MLPLGWVNIPRFRVERTDAVKAHRVLFRRRIPFALGRDHVDQNRPMKFF